MHAAAAEVYSAKNRKFPISAEMQLSAAAAHVKYSSCESAFTFKTGLLRLEGCAKRTHTIHFVGQR